jgi:hypothetical protein
MGDPNNVLILGRRPASHGGNYEDHTGGGGGGGGGTIYNITNINYRRMGKYGKCTAPII